MRSSNWPRGQNLPSEIPSGLTATLRVGPGGNSHTDRKRIARAKGLSRTHRSHSPHLSQRAHSGHHHSRPGIRQAARGHLFDAPTLWFFPRPPSGPLRSPFHLPGVTGATREPGPTRSRRPHPPTDPPALPSGRLRATPGAYPSARGVAIACSPGLCCGHRESNRPISPCSVPPARRRPVEGCRDLVLGLVVFERWPFFFDDAFGACCGGGAE